MEIINSKQSTCLICLKNNDDDELILFDVLTQEWDSITCLTKLQNVLNAEIVVYEETLICSECLEDLNKAYEFKEKVIKALDYWSTKFEDNVSGQNKTSEEDNDIDNNEISDLITFKDDTGSTAVSDEEIKIESANSEVVESNEEENSESSSFPCSKCNAIFLTVSDAVNHDCEDDTKKELEKVHRKRKKPKKPQDCKCELCDLMFSKRWKLNKHSELHDAEKKFICVYCNHAFKQSSHLRDHLTTHTGERNFSCPYCGKQFQRKSSQQRHMRSHLAPPGEKCKKTPFLCNICGKSFPYSNGAQRHMRIHSGDRRYECDVCNKKFSQSTHLKVHSRTHTGEKPYMCSICGDTFSFKASLQKHVNGHSDSKNNVKIYPNLEPNLGRTLSRNDDDDDEDRKSFITDDSLYDHQLEITCSQ